jgi:hypothetical protein
MAGLSLVKRVQLMIFSTQVYSSVQLALSIISCTDWTNEKPAMCRIESRWEID